MSVTHNVTLDVDKRRFCYEQAVHVRVGDKATQTVTAALTKNGASYSPPSGSTAKIEVLKHDNTWSVSSATISGSSVSGILPLEAISCPGECKRAYFRITNSAGTQDDTTEDFYLYVFPNATDDAIESRPYSDQLDELIAAADQELQDTIEEVRDVRNGFDGTVYDSAGDAVRNGVRSAQAFGGLYAVAALPQVSTGEFVLTKEYLVQGGLYAPGSDSLHRVRVMDNYRICCTPTNSSQNSYTGPSLGLACPPFFLAKGTVVTVASGYTCSLYQVEQFADGGRVEYRWVDTRSFTSSSITIATSGLYYVARLQESPLGSAFTPEDAGGLVTFSVSEGLDDTVSAIKEDVSAISDDVSQIEMYGIGYDKTALAQFATGQSAITEGMVVQGGLYKQSTESGALVKLMDSRSNCCTPILSALNSYTYGKVPSASKPMFLGKGTVVHVASGYSAALYRVEQVVVDGGVEYKWVKTYSVPSDTDYTIPVTGLYLVARIRKDPYASSDVLTPEEVDGVVTIDAGSSIIDVPGGGATPSEAGVISLRKNPYPHNWAEMQEVLSVTHAHCKTTARLGNLGSLYGHLAVSNYHQSTPCYPASQFFPTVPDVLESPNAEFAHFPDSTWQTHVNGLGSFLSRETAGSRDETVIETISAIVSSLQYPNCGGATLNHPSWSRLSVSDVCSIVDRSNGVIAIEIYNASATRGNPDDMEQNIAIWDGVLSTGRQLFALCVPDHEVELYYGDNPLPFGYNHVVVRAKTEQEVLLAYRLGMFYSSTDSNDLLFTNLSYVGGVLSVETSKACDIKVVTASGATTTQNVSSLTYTPTQSDVYVRIEATDGENILFSNAVMM